MLTVHVKTGTSMINEATNEGMIWNSTLTALPFY